MRRGWRMSDSSADRGLYERAVEKLIARVREMHESEWSPTPLRKELESIAQQLERTADTLAKGGAAQFDIELVRDEDPPPASGVDGYSIDVAPEDSNLGA